MIVDIKTGKTPVSKDDAQQHAQLAMYQLAVAEGMLPADADVAEPGGARLVYIGRTGAAGAAEREQDPMTPASPRRMAQPGPAGGRSDRRAAVHCPAQRRLRALPDTAVLPGPRRRVSAVTLATVRYSPAELACALGLFPPTAEQAAVIAAPPGPLVVIAGAGAGKTETMAARVVWLIANGYAEPGQVLGLTFTRKAAGQLLRRVRSRLARLAGIGLGAGSPEAAEPVGTPVVSTYHAFAGSLLRDYGLLLPVEPDTRLLSETELWQLAFDVVNDYGGELRTDKTPAAVTSMVLRLWGQLAEHLVDTRQLRDTHVELERLVHDLPAGPYQRDRGPSQWLLRLLATQTERAELVPLLDALHERMRAAKVMDFGAQMAFAARLAATFPQVGQDLRNRYRVVLLDEYQDTGHAQRVALSALFGGGVDDGLALTAVGDPIQSIYGWRGASATNLPRFATDFPRPDGAPAPVLELRTSWRNPPRALQVANAISAEARRRSVAVRALRSRPDAPPGTVRCALLPDVRAEREWIADQLHAHYQRAQRRRASARLPPRCWCAATPMPRPWPMPCAPAGSRSRWSAWPACCRSPRWPTWWPCCGWSPTPRPARPRCGC